MPDSSERRIKRTAETILRTICATFQVFVALSTEAGFQASKVWSSGCQFGEQVFSRVPLNLVVRFTPGEVLAFAASQYQPPSAGNQASLSTSRRRWRIGPRPLPLLRA
eukprot:1672413-Amphidinium_carterae.1